MTNLDTTKLLILLALLPGCIDLDVSMEAGETGDTSAGDGDGDAPGDGDGDPSTGDGDGDPSTGDGDGDGDGDGEPTGDGDGDPTGDGDGDGCEVSEPSCDLDNRCWVTATGWESEAQIADWDDIEAGILAGTLVPAPTIGEQCWTYAEGAHTCIEATEACGEVIDLVGRPLPELELLMGNCAAVGPWGIAVTDTMGGCWGVFTSNIAVRLRAL